MTPEAQRIAIAEFLGWTKIAPSDYVNLKRLSGIAPGAMRVKHQGEYIDSFSDVPDFLNDLNACHEMEKRLTVEQWGNYKAHLIDLVFSTPPTNRGIVHSTAAQRSEAFLKATGKWV